MMMLKMNLLKNLKRNSKIFWYNFVVIFFHKIEVCFAKIFKLKKDTSIIPYGFYCYAVDEEKYKNKLEDDFSLPIIPCKYYRYTGKSLWGGCTYLGSFEIIDQCKSCGENKPYDDYK